MKLEAKVALEPAFVLSQFSRKDVVNFDFDIAANRAELKGRPFPGLVASFFHSFGIGFLYPSSSACFVKASSFLRCVDLNLEAVDAHVGFDTV